MPENQSTWIHLAAAGGGVDSSIEVESNRLRLDSTGGGGTGALPLPALRKSAQNRHEHVFFACLLAGLS
jgi:hypothetical protein